MNRSRASIPNENSRIARDRFLDKQIGSLEEGKDADLVLWSNDPVGTWAEVRVVVVGGRVVLQR